MVIVESFSCYIYAPKQNLTGFQLDMYLEINNNTPPPTKTIPRSLYLLICVMISENE